MAAVIVSVGFALTMVLAVAVIASTWRTYRGAALANLAALRALSDTREFRVSTIAQGRVPLVPGLRAGMLRVFSRRPAPRHALRAAA
ncbi:hypothetical protein ACFO0A_08185 [Novosphingobium tardum]|uniref:Uncharacterized protein n=1 Tax=Novosphingobium tardum TaxID=1538021 RepID=A0ABV8RRV9_9SPHN